MERRTVDACNDYSITHSLIHSPPTVVEESFLSGVASGVIDSGAVCDEDGPQLLAELYTLFFGRGVQYPNRSLFIFRANASKSKLSLCKDFFLGRGLARIFLIFHLITFVTFPPTTS